MSGNVIPPRFARGYGFSPQRLAAAVWIAATLLWVFLIATQQFRPIGYWLLDWHVYAAGARDFVDGTLYTVPLTSPYHLPISEFNYPPMAAIVVLPLTFLPDQVAGTIWVVVNILAVAGTAVVAARIMGASQPLLWGGIGFFAYTIHPWAALAFLGNNTPLVLFLVTAFAYLHLAGRDRLAGSLLGAAVVLKLWPAALLLVLIRERRRERMWQAMATATIVVAAVVLVTWARLGLGVTGPAITAMQATAVVEPDNAVLFISWLRTTQDWWPVWGGFLVACVLGLIPARGILGIGLAMFAGLAVVPNLWRTYLATLVVAGALVAVGVARRRWPTEPTSGQRRASVVSEPLEPRA